MRLTILHLSDFHFGQPGPKVYLKALANEFWDDLQHLTEQSGAIDLVVVTGDIAFSGDSREYAEALEFFNRLRSKLVTANAHVKLVPLPGNHDVVRPPAYDPVVRTAAREPHFVVQQMQQAIAENRNGDDYLRTVKSAFQPYVEWMRLIDWLPTDFVAGAAPGDVSVRIEGHPEIGLIGLNSSLLHLSDAEEKDHRLAILECQIDSLLDLESSRGLTACYLVATHHPLEWLDSPSQELVRDGLFAALPVGVHLFGHRHVSDFTTLARGGDPRPIHSLQGKSFFGTELLADGVTERIHGFSLLRIDDTSGQPMLQVAPRQATRRPTGGYTFAPERSAAWYLPRGSEWTHQLPLTVVNAIAPRTESPTKFFGPMKLVNELATWSSTYPSAKLDELSQQFMDKVDPASRPSHWRRLPSETTFLHNVTSLSSLLGDEIAPTSAELLYIWALLLLTKSRTELAIDDLDTLRDLEGKPEWSRDVVGTLSAYDRLIARANDIAAPADSRVILQEWLLRRVISRSSIPWGMPEVRELARRLASVLERRPGHIEEVADRLFEECQLIGSGPIPDWKIDDSWGYALNDEHHLEHVRSSRSLTYATVLHALDFDPIENGRELVEQVGVVPGFDLLGVHRDIDEMRWLVTPSGDAQLVALAFDPAVEAALFEYVSGIRALAKRLPAWQEGDAIRHHVLDRIANPSVNARIVDSRPSYDRPISRLIMDSEKVRSLLMGEQLYGQARLAIRELYQNSLDACRYRQLRHRYFEATNYPRIGWTGQIEFSAAYDDGGIVPTLACQDNGTGMTREILRDCFLNAGARFVETAAFAEEQAAWLKVDPSLQLVPNSTFGIGANSYFMLADVVEVITRAEGPDGRLATTLKLQMNAGSSVARLTEDPQSSSLLPVGGTAVRLHLRPEFRSVSRLQLGNFLDELVYTSPFQLSVQEGHEKRIRAPGEMSPEVSGPMEVAWEHGESAAWWTIRRGPLLADGIKTPEELVGLMVNLHGAEKPVLRVDRNAVVKWNTPWVLDRTSESSQSLSGWPDLRLAWLWGFCERYPVHGQHLFDDLTKLRREVLLGQSRLWGQTIDLGSVGCFPGDRYLIGELRDSRWDSEYSEIEIPSITRRSDRFGGLTVMFPSCLRPWRRRVWLESLAELFEGWQPDAFELALNPIETVRNASELSFPVWEPERLSGLVNPDAIDAALLASQPDIVGLSWGRLDTGHSSMVDIVALVHGAHRCQITLGDAVTRLARFVRFGLRGIPNVAEHCVPTRLDCQLVAALGRAWPATRRISKEDFLHLLPLCQEIGLTFGEATNALQALLKQVGITFERPRETEDWLHHVPSSREVKFFGFGEYDRGRELRYGRGTRAALIRGAHRADMNLADVAKLVKRYRGFGMSKYSQALRALRLKPSDPEMLRAWSANFDSRAPWVDEETFRRGFISDEPSTTEELLAHALFYAVLAEIDLREACSRVFAFPGLAENQKNDLSDVPAVHVDERDLEILRSRIGQRSSYQDKRFAGIGQEALVRRRWTALELKAASQETNTTMNEVFDRLKKFTCLGVELPDCSPADVDQYDFSDLEISLLTTEDPRLGAFGRFPHERDRKPIVGPIPALHMMAVAADEKLPLEDVVSMLQKLAPLGIESSAQPLPATLRDFIPTKSDVRRASRLSVICLGQGICEFAYGEGDDVRQVCDSIEPWVGWVLQLAPEYHMSLESARKLSGSFVPSYSDLSFYVAAKAQANRRAGQLDWAALVVLAAQANVTLQQATEYARRMAGLFLTDDVVLSDDPPEQYRDQFPDSGWVAAVSDDVFSGRMRSSILSILGLKRSQYTQLRTRLAPQELVEQSNAVILDVA